ncbi:hypothetical protein HDU93_004938, partial [Gonapodya sp. JEL0774]
AEIVYFPFELATWLLLVTCQPLSKMKRMENDRPPIRGQVERGQEITPSEGANIQDSSSQEGINRILAELTKLTRKVEKLESLVAESQKRAEGRT